MRSVQHAFELFLKELKRVPRLEVLRWLHSRWDELGRLGFFDPTQPWLIPSELLDYAKFLILYGRDKRSWRSFDPSRPLNRYKDFWSLTESENQYTETLDFLGVFVLRLVYQQFAFLIHRDRIEKAFAQTRGIYLAQNSNPQSARFNPALRFRTQFGVRLEDFLQLADILYRIFRTSPRHDRSDIAGRIPPNLAEALPPTLQFLAADSWRFKELHDITSTSNLIEKPYEFNPLLRYPIVSLGRDYWCPFPELIVYASTRGLLFCLSEVFGGEFSRVFGDLYADYAVRLTNSSLGADCVLTEQEERHLGLEGKTNDFTVILEDKAVLFECKTSALFSTAKRRATLEEVRNDIRKNLVNPDKGKGLVQLYEKGRAIASHSLPPLLAEKYKWVSRTFPVLLLYDRVHHANAPQTLRNLLVTELKGIGASDFDFQIWHIEELENLLEIADRNNFLKFVGEKFDTPKFSSWDLNSYLFNRTGRSHLRPHLFVPRGDTPAIRILRQLADRD
jgi:hypothetical protein